MQMVVGIPARERPDEVLGTHSQKLDCIWIVMLLIETPVQRRRTTPISDLQLLSPLGAGKSVANLLLVVTLKKNLSHTRKVLIGHVQYRSVRKGLSWLERQTEGGRKSCSGPQLSAN